MLTYYIKFLFTYCKIHLMFKKYLAFLLLQGVFVKYRVSDISKLLSIPASTLRYYDNQGLLPNLEKNESGIRIFQEKDIEILYSINCLKKAGLSIKDIKKYIYLIEQGDSTIEQRYKIFLNKKKDLINEIKKLNEILEFVEYKTWLYEKAKETGSFTKAMEIFSSVKPKNVISVKQAIELKKEEHKQQGK
ncbi:MerR subfamily transcriptional regulator [Malacoplasma penetrans HF-2]|uniref:MerR subfamily transcriptional regulator n=1 Tax=Malacoplasma penetrans (strain HF-2) TaxID=272633 RepID=Q8EVH0_MALP2|nr:MerR subfamily transcriptional regulator [Malacoplasma penetrans HF-2]